MTDLANNSLHLQHYSGSLKYLHPRRLQGYLEQAKFLRGGEEVLEIGPGPGIFGQIAKNVSSLYHSMDYDPQLAADIHADVTDPELLQKIGRTYDVVFCCQVLEHLPFEKSLEGLKNVLSLARKRAIVSVPDNRVGINVMVNFVKWYYSFVITVPFTGRTVTVEEDGHHHWEVNQRNVGDIRRAFAKVGPHRLVKNFRSGVRPYQHFFVFER